MANNTTIGIVIPTYQRVDGKTPELLSRALKSIKNQTHTDYKVFLIGDAYADNTEFTQLAKTIIDTDKIVFENLPFAKERDKYQIGSEQLWCSGGVNARNYGIELAKSIGFEYICHLDHDDYWHPLHLEMINNVIENINDVSFINTCSTYRQSYLPRVELTNEVIPFIPKSEGLIHSSVCINHKLIPLKYRDTFEELGIASPADADLWNRMSKYILEHNLKSYLITSITCYHPTEKQ
jgi:glycosyltransferase involved in cell wall biosynthesis